MTVDTKHQREVTNLHKLHEHAFCSTAVCILAAAGYLDRQQVSQRKAWRMVDGHKCTTCSECLASHAGVGVQQVPDVEA